MWILIVVYSIGGPGTLSQAVAMQEFESESSCEAARVWIAGRAVPGLDTGGGLAGNTHCTPK